ncbi:MAG: hypothetical protein ACE5GR_02310 [Nitrosopumilus sp.]
MTHTNDELESFFDETDAEFENIESVIKDALEIIQIYENEIELAKLK